jgi:hypothetical protein
LVAACDDPPPDTGIEAAPGAPKIEDSAGAGSRAPTVTLVATRSTWKYWDRGTVASGWAAPGFDDAAWPSGPAELGYGDGDEATTVTAGATSKTRYITTWFRHAFTVSDPSALAALSLALRRDDGAVVYLNGVEVLRDNMPTGTISTSTRASASVTGSAEDRLTAHDLPVTGLVAGANVLAVEVHQSSSGSTDLSFELSLTGELRTTEEPPEPSPEGTLRFGVIGDYGTDDAEERDNADMIKGWDPDLVVTLGDNNYPLGEASTIDHNIGQYFHELIGDYRGDYGLGADTNRFWPALGDCDLDTDLGDAYLDYFTLPGNERYYDVAAGPVHFFMLNSDRREPDGTSSTSTQAMWLRDALAESTAAWKVVIMHHPPYVSDTTAATRMRWPYAEWGADVVMSGHTHVYERIEKDGILYVVNGLGSRGLMDFGTSPIEGSVFRYNDDHGAMLGVATDEELTFEVYLHTGELLDTFSLQRDGGGDPPDEEPPATTTTVALVAVADATIDAATPTSRLGTATTCKMDGDSSNGLDRSCLIRWDLTSIPQGSVVTAVSLGVYVTNETSGLYDVYPLRRSFDEAQATWSLAATGVSWQVAGATGSDDRGAAVAQMGSRSTGATTVTLPAEVAQGWVDAPTSNFGLVVADPDVSNGFAFASREASTASQRPTLTVTYRAP